jgi:hypothetical protein
MAKYVREHFNAISVSTYDIGLLPRVDEGRQAIRQPVG